MVTLKNFDFYFKHFDEHFYTDTFLYKYPFIYLEYQAIKQKLLPLSTYNNQENPLNNFSLLLDLDAKLQILYELSHHIETLSLSEKDVLSMVENDSKYYYLEHFRNDKSSPVPHSLLFLNLLE